MQYGPDRVNDAAVAVVENQFEDDIIDVKRGKGAALTPACNKGGKDATGPWLGSNSNLRRGGLAATVSVLPAVEPARLVETGGGSFG